MADAPLPPDAQTEPAATPSKESAGATNAQPASKTTARTSAARRRRSPSTQPSAAPIAGEQAGVEDMAVAAAADSLPQGRVESPSVEQVAAEPVGTPVAAVPPAAAAQGASPVEASLADAVPAPKARGRRAAAPIRSESGDERPSVAEVSATTARTRRASSAKNGGAATATKPRASTRKSSLPTIVPPKPRLPRSGKTVLDGLGVPVFGARHGAPQTIEWSGLAEEYRRGSLISFLRHRRWVYATATTDQLFIAVAIVDGGPSGTAFCMITDLETGEVLADSSRPGGMRPLVSVNDHPLEGLSAAYRLPGTDYRFERPVGSHETRITVRLRNTADSLPGLRWVPGISSIPLLRNLPTASAQPWLDIDLTLEAGVAPALTAISPVKADGGLVTSTIKTSTMNTWGTVTLHGETTRTLSLDGGTGAMDYTNGFLPRHTFWKWASTTGRLADGRLFGLNLVSGFAGIGDETNENAVWLDGALSPLDPGVRILLDKDDLNKPWTIRTVDGSVHLHFQPLSIHREGLNLGVIRSKFVQPTGLFSGHVMVEGERVVIDRMPGVVEDQDILW